MASDAAAVSRTAAFGDGAAVAFPGSTVKVTLREEQIPDTAYEEAFSDEREEE